MPQKARESKRGHEVLFRAIARRLVASERLEPRAALDGLHARKLSWILIAGGDDVRWRHVRTDRTIFL